MKILFIGPQGAGKSTQGKMLADFLKVPYISTGDIFREIASSDSQTSENIKQILNSGNLADDRTTSELVKQRLDKKDCRDGFVMDGYPRTQKQIENYDPGFDTVIYLDLDNDTSVARLLGRGRADDTTELIEQRLKLYATLTEPILNYYKQKDVLYRVDGSESIEEIQTKLRGIVHG